MLSDVVVVVHLAIMLFITTGLPLIYIGRVRQWA